MHDGGTTTSHRQPVCERQFPTNRCSRRRMPYHRLPGHAQQQPSVRFGLVAKQVRRQSDDRTVPDHNRLQKRERREWRKRQPAKRQESWSSWWTPITFRLQFRKATREGLVGCVCNVDGVSVYPDYRIFVSIAEHDFSGFSANLRSAEWTLRMHGVPPQSTHN